jgi:predicted DNA-binding transcriptional regulator AlpA
MEQRNDEILTAKEVATFLKKSPSWVYDNWEEIGGVKLGGSYLFPKKEKLYERLFSKRERVEIRLHNERTEIHGSMVQNQKGGERGRSQKARRVKKSGSSDGAPNRHGLLGTG